MSLEGLIYVVKDDIDTDAIIPARYLTSMDPDFLREHAMEDLDPALYPIPFINEKTGKSNYTFVVAGKNFGCGSSREHATIALKAVGIQAVISQTFARIYFRNSVNGADVLPVNSDLYLPDHVKTGDHAILKPEEGILDINGQSYKTNPFVGTVKDIIDAGGLTKYNKPRLGL